MSLSREQFNELRKQGLSVDQIVEFQNRAGDQITPQTSPKETVKLWDTSGFTSGFKGIAKGVGKLALGVGTIGRTFQEGAGRLAGIDLQENSLFDIGSEQRRKADAALTPQNTGERIASTITEIGATMAPQAAVGRGIQAAKAASSFAPQAVAKTRSGIGFARQMLGRASVGAVTGTVQGGGDFDRDTAIGGAVEVAFPLAGRAVSWGGNVLKGLASIAGGTGTDVIEQVLKSPKAALAGGATDELTGLRQTADTIRSGTKQLKRNAGEAFAQATEKHTQQLDKTAFKTLTDDFLDEFDTTSFIDTSKISKVRDVVNGWTDHSAQGINKLASKISKFYTGSANSSDTDALVSGLNRTIRNFVGEQVPEIADANARYADKMDLLEQMDAIFKLKGAVDSRQGMQKTAEAVARLFNANRGIAREGVEELQRELGVDVLGREAGRQLASNTVTRFQAGADFTGQAVRSLIPQKTILKLTAATGIAKDAIESRLDQLDPAARAATIEFLTDLLGEGEELDPQPQSAEGGQ